jgi:pimeloyl-ACP methyl ester carboxylesterase
MSQMQEGIGGQFDVSLPSGSHWSIYSWHFSLWNEDESYFACAQQSLPDVMMPVAIQWNGLTSCQSAVGDGMAFPPGDYSGRVTVEYGSTRPIAQGLTSFTITVLPNAPAPTPTPSPSITPTPNPTSKLHPVLLIHGLTGYPELWQDASHNSDYFALLESWGYPADYIAAYHYTGVGIGKGGYNNQGDIPEMAAGMTEAVDTLHQISLAHGGDGKVDIVCHSMGGLIARQYLREHPDDSYLGKVISVGTPYQGSWLMTLDNGIGGGQVLALNFIINLLVEATGQEANVNQRAAQEMTPGSSLLRALDQIVYEPDIDYYTFVGQNRVQFDQKLFDLDLKSGSYEVGDAVVLDGSASLVSKHQPSHTTIFDGGTHELNLNIKQTGLFTFVLDASSFNVNSWPYFHNNMTQQEGIQSGIKEILLK